MAALPRAALGTLKKAHDSGTVTIARHEADADLIVVGDFLTYEPYGLMFR